MTTKSRGAMNRGTEIAKNQAAKITKKMFSSAFELFVTLAVQEDR